MKPSIIFMAFSGLVLLSSCSRTAEFYGKDIPVQSPLKADSGKAHAGVAVKTEDNGPSETEIIDEFEQKKNVNKKIDILWVVDNSKSMRDEQESLGQNFNAFIKDFITQEVDFKMAITVTDATPNWKGLMIGNKPDLLTSASAKKNPIQFIEDFKNTIRVGTNGSADEQGLNAVESFMERYSSTFIRKDAYLIVIMVSDEEDSSPRKVQDYVSMFQNLKANHGLVKVYSIVDTRFFGDRPIRPNEHYAFARYKEISEATSGLVFDINQDFHSSLNQIGKSVIDLLNNFPLKAKPLARSLRVYVNEELTLESAYSVTGQNALRFKPSAVPAPGSKIRAEYLVKVKKVK